ncbi:MAG TPA: hypothetical protein VEV61_04935 [Streptosporangiaceae bacterium]|nr:hypothetical protein [Streptosporangiaceae bacterium]
MNRMFNRQRGLRATLTLAAAGAATLAVAGGSALAATHSLSQSAAACVSKASTPVRHGHLSGILGAAPASKACQTANPRNVLGNAGDTAMGVPPLIWHGGAVMGTAETGPIVITPIYWTPAGHPMDSAYKSLITQYLTDVAAASGSATNVFSILPEYFGSDGSIRYNIQVGNPITDTNPLPANGCKLNSKDTTAIYADGSGYDACLDDAQVQAQTNSVVAAQKLPVNLSHIYVMFLPKHVESCFNPGTTTNAKNACTINHQPSAAFCAYHSQAGNGTEYANMPFPIYLSPVGFTCGSNARIAFPGVIETPNNNPDADTEISPTSHEVNELITNPDNNGVTASGWFDVAGFENGDECAFTYGTPQGAPGHFFNQVINGHHYLTQEEFSNSSFFASGGGCLQHP